MVILHAFNWIREGGAGQEAGEEASQAASPWFSAVFPGSTQQLQQERGDHSAARLQMLKHVKKETLEEEETKGCRDLKEDS